MVRCLLRLGADVECYEDDARLTPLYMAVVFHAKRVIPILLKHGANPHAQSDEGLTPSELAEQHGIL